LLVFSRYPVKTSIPKRPPITSIGKNIRMNLDLNNLEYSQMIIREINPIAVAFMGIVVAG
tara:strand:- start:156 stop:335 length:180 start_codon:yes stop_codon:yes gene_type:complete